MAGPPPAMKLCPSCGNSVPADSNICSTCGYNFNTGPYSQPPSNGPSYGSYNPGTTPGQGYTNPHWQANYPRPDNYGGGSTAADGMAVASLVLGILAVPSFCLWCVSGPLAILALIFGGLGLNGRNRGMAIAGMICAGISILLLVGFIVFAVTNGTYSNGRYRWD